MKQIDISFLREMSVKGDSDIIFTLFPGEKDNITIFIS